MIDTSSLDSADVDVPSIDIVLPCLDEAGALPWVLSHLPAPARAIVVDNGSTDGSPEIARAYGALVVTAERRGYGAACQAGLEAATADLVAFCDCDASLDPTELLRFVPLLVDGSADLVMGRRRPSARGAWPLSARVANWELARRIRRHTGLAVTDLGPLRLARREALLSLDVADRRSGYPLEVLLRAAQADWRVAQVDVDYRPRVGKSKVTGTVRGTVQAVRDMNAVLNRADLVRS
jgi:glycosyltransferase involved in cell wall biosynthesis